MINDVGDGRFLMFLLFFVLILALLMIATLEEYYYGSQTGIYGSTS